MADPSDAGGGWRSPAARAAQAGHFLDRETGAPVPPIHASTTFARGADHELIGDYIYARNGNPTCARLENLMADLDEGAASMAFASGLAAVAAVFETVPAGGRVVAPRVMYHGARSLLKRMAAKRGLIAEFFDPADADDLARVAGAAPVDLVWVETSVNPTWDVVDVAAAAGIARGAGAVLAVDATVTPPPTIRPLSLGADIVFQSATKYLNGHSDVLAGVLTAREANDRWAEIGDIRKLAGGVLGPFEAWLLLRGLRTLYLRFERASENAMRLARHFDGHPKVETVLYPGLEAHPGHAVARRQFTGGFGGMLSLMIKGGEEAAKAVCANCELFIHATSLGGVESLIEHRRTVEPPDSPAPGNLLRLSAGVEPADDLIADLERALA